jgi:hypothetical protein
VVDAIRRPAGQLHGLRRRRGGPSHPGRGRDHRLLEEGEIIGVGFSVTDDDAVEPEGTSATYSGYWVNSGDVNVYWQENAFVDYTLLGFDPSIWVTDETAVEEDSWGRIKSSFTN